MMDMTEKMEMMEMLEIWKYGNDGMLNDGRMICA
jgi:hypothetical protein